MNYNNAYGKPRQTVTPSNDPTNPYYQNKQNNVSIAKGKQVQIVLQTGEVLQLDSATSVEKVFSGNATSQPMMDTSLVTDNYTMRNTEFSVEGVVSDYNLFSTSNRMSSQEFMEKVEELMKSKLTVSIIAPDGLSMGDCLVTSARFTRTNKVSNGYKVSIRFKQIRLAQRLQASDKSITKKPVAKKNEGTNPREAKGASSSSRPPLYRHEIALDNLKANWQTFLTGTTDTSKLPTEMPDPYPSQKVNK